MTPPSSYLNRKTPGVYITEFDAFPTSIIGVQTAVPAFLGYTEQAIVNGEPVLLKPIAITSLADYEQIFGGAYNASYDFVALPSTVTPDFSDGSKGYLIVPAQGQPRFNLYNSMRLFFANGGGNCFVVSVGTYKASGTVKLADLLAGLEAVSNQAGPTLLVAPDAVLLPSNGTTATQSPGSSVPTSTDYATLTQKMLQQAFTLQDRIALFDLYGTEAVTQTATDTNLNACVSTFQSGIQAANVQDTSYGAAYFPFLGTTIVQASEINSNNFNPAQLKPILTALNQARYSNDPARQAQVQTSIDAIGQTYDSTLNSLLINTLPVYAQVLSLTAQKAGILPPSAALAGLYAANDQGVGVWNAPANVSVVATTGLTVNLDDAQQGTLNVPLNGYAVNVIRSFVNRGPVVWGARTLNGNSSDWRYIQVRRTVIYIEQSIKNALNQYVFAPNTGITWAAVTQSISAFLTNLWSQGGLMGDKASEAFTVHCGIGSTMTGQDILNGAMIVQVTLQMVHSAEFIELTFTQTMQGT